MRIGIDVGGTNTDAALLDRDHVVAATKHPTSQDVTSGIVAALTGLSGQHAFNSADIDAVMIGTTHFVNALVEGRHLAPTACLRLGLPATASLPPFVDWPTSLADAVRAQRYLVHGGHEFDGAHISDLEPAEIRAAAGDMAARGVRSVAISAVFSPVNAEFETQAAEILAAELGGEVAISLSHEIGRIGLLERENATIINAALRELAETIVSGLASSIADFGLQAPLFLSQNDGTLMDLDFARRYPVLTFASGPTNSMRGAAALCGLETCAVVDIGGTTTDVGVVTDGFPREATSDVTVAGVRTNFRMPDVASIGIGGGSMVAVDGSQVGPESVGYELTSQALVFGGDQFTATDAAVAAGMVDIGEPAAVRNLDPDAVSLAMNTIADRITALLERMRTSAEPIPVVAVGGGSILLPDALPALGTLHRPEYFAVANAIGAAIAQVSGEVDRVYSLADGQREELVAQARAEAIEKAVAAGATEQSTRVVDVDEIPIPYLPGNATRIRVKAVGDLALKENR